MQGGGPYRNDFEALLEQCASLAREYRKTLDRIDRISNLFKKDKQPMGEILSKIAIAIIIIATISTISWAAFTVAKRDKKLDQQCAVLCKAWNWQTLAAERSDIRNRLHICKCQTREREFEVSVGPGEFWDLNKFQQAIKQEEGSNQCRALYNKCLIDLGLKVEETRQ